MIENNAKCQGVKTHQEVDLPDHLQCSSLSSSSYNQIEFCINFDDTNGCPLEINDPVDQPMHILSQAFLGWQVLGTVPFDGGTELLCTKASLLPPWSGNWSSDYCLCLVLAQHMWIFYSPKDSTSCQLNFHPRQMRKHA